MAPRFARGSRTSYSGIWTPRCAASGPWTPGWATIRIWRTRFCRRWTISCGKRRSCCGIDGSYGYNRYDRNNGYENGYYERPYELSRDDRAAGTQALRATSAARLDYVDAHAARGAPHGVHGRFQIEAVQIGHLD